MGWTQMSTVALLLNVPLLSPPLPSPTPISTAWVSWLVYLVLLLSLWIFTSLCSTDQICSTLTRKTRSSFNWSLLFLRGCLRMKKVLVNLSWMTTDNTLYYSNYRNLTKENYYEYI